jgi:hypothetical protein
VTRIIVERLVQVGAIDRAGNIGARINEQRGGAAGLVHNLRKVGVLISRIEPDIAALGISLAA